jgi:trigger factor
MSARIKVKKQLFDALDEKTSFPIPACMYDAEFNSIWAKLEQAKKEGDEDIKKKSDDELRKEYGKIAERRVKLGIVLSNIALKNKLQVNQNELSQAVMEQARQYPGQERAIFEFYKKNPQQLQELRGPILEEKAVDFIIGKAKVTERKVSSEQLMSEDDAEESGEEVKTKKKAANK